MATGLVVVEFVWHYSIALPRTPLLGASGTAIFSIRSELQPVLSQITLPWQRGMVAVEFVWRHSIAWPRKPLVIRKDLRDISYTCRVIADFVPNFVAMATGISRDRIWLALFNSPTPKTPCYTQRSPWYLLYKPSYRRFCPKFRCHGNRGNPGLSLNNAVK